MREQVIEVIVTTEIAASADTVRRILTELGAYPQWNPFIRSARGSLEPGGTLHLRVRSTPRIPLAFRATVIERRARRELRWVGSVGRPWVASGDHRFVLEAIGDRRVRFVQSETFSGVLPRLGARLLVREARAGFEAMNRALAVRAERAQPTVRPAADAAE